MKKKVSLLSQQEQKTLLDGLHPDTIKQMARGEWWWESRPEQVPPEGNWHIHLYLAGRGTGKTRSGAEWLVDRSEKHPIDTSGFPTERLVMAYNLSDARTTCIEGASGILRVLDRREIPYHYVRSPKPRIILTETEAKIHFTGAHPDVARGFNLADAWLDEVVKWDYPKKTWVEGIMPALRADLPGDSPKAFVTTTPKPIDLLQEWLKRADGTVSIARGSTFDNADNLSKNMLTELLARYEGTAVGRQELYGEMLDSLDGHLFGWNDIAANRVDIGPEQVAHRTVAVDPGLTGSEEGDETGVVVVCRDERDHMYVVADETAKLSGREAAMHAWDVYQRYNCDTLVYESNLGKAWMQQVFTDAYKELARAGKFPIDSTPPLVPVFSTQGKKLRAEPVAMRYEQSRVHHIGEFPKLESQMLGFDPLTSKSSPDRLDALVHACRHLMDGEKRRSRIISPLTHHIPALNRRQY